MARTPLILAREANVIRVAFENSPPPTPRFPGASGMRVRELEAEQGSMMVARPPRAEFQQYCA